MTERVKISDARAAIADVIRAAREEMQVTILTDRGEDAAAVVPLAVYEKYRLWQDQEDYRAMTAGTQARAEGHAVGVTLTADEISNLAALSPADLQERLKTDFLSKARGAA